MELRNMRKFILGSILIVLTVTFSFIGADAQLIQQPQPPKLPAPNMDYHNTQRQYNNDLKEWRKQREIVDQINRNTMELNKQKYQEQNDINY